MHNPYDGLSEDQIIAKFQQLQSQINTPQAPMPQAPVQESQNPYDNLSEDEQIKLYHKLQDQIKAEKDFEKNPFKYKAAKFAYDMTQNPLKFTAKTARNVASGAAGIADFPMLPIHLAMMAKGIEPQTITGAVADTIDSLTGGYTKPQTKGENIAESVFQTLGGMRPTQKAAKAAIDIAKSGAIPKILSKPLGFLGKFAGVGNEMTASNIAANAASSAIVRKEIEEGASPLQAMLMGTVAGTAAGKGVGSLAFNGAKKVSDIPKSAALGAAAGAGNLLGIDPRLVQTMNKAGFKDSKTVGDVSKFKSTKVFQHILSSGPFMDDVFQKQYAKRPDEFYKVLGIESPKTQLELGNDTIKMIDNIAKKHNLKTKDLRNKFTGHLTDQNKNVDVSNTLSTFGKIRKDLDNDVAEDFLFDNTQTGTFFKKLEQMTPKNKSKKDSASSVFNAYMGHKPEINVEPLKKKVSFKAVEGLRTAANDAAAQEYGKLSDLQGGRLKYFARNLSNDMDNHFKNLEGDALKDWRNYNDYYSTFTNDTTPNLNHLKNELSNRTISVADTLKGVVAKEGDKPFNIMSHIDDPAQRREFVSNIFNELATNNKNEVSPMFFVDNYKKLQPEVKAMLLKGYGKDAKKIDHLIEAVDLTKATMKLANFSNSGTHINLAKAGSQLVAAVTSGSIIGVSNTLAGIGLGYGLSKGLMANPKFIDAVAYASKMKNKTQAPFAINKLDKFIPGLQKEYMKQVQEGASHGYFGRTKKAAVKSTQAVVRDNGKKDKK